MITANALPTARHIINNDNVSDAQKLRWQYAYTLHTEENGYKTRPFNQYATYTDLRGTIWYNDDIYSNLDNMYFGSGIKLSDENLAIGEMPKTLKENIENYGYLPLYKDQNNSYCETTQTTPNKFSFFTYSDRWNGNYELFTDWYDETTGNGYIPKVIDESAISLISEPIYAYNVGSAHTLENGLSSNFDTTFTFKSFDFFHDIFFYWDNNSRIFKDQQADIGRFDKLWNKLPTRVTGFNSDRCWYYPIDLNRGILRNRLYNRPLYSLEECNEYNGLL